jgi:uncharacterized protein (TIGR00369 family)
VATLPNAETSRQHWEVIERGEHLFQQLLIRDLPSPDGHLVIEMDIRPEFLNVRGALQGGLIAVLIDMCSGRLAYETCDHENGFSTATSDLNVHFLSPVTVGPARAEATRHSKGQVEHCPPSRGNGRWPRQIGSSFDDYFHGAGTTIVSMTLRSE